MRDFGGISWWIRKGRPQVIYNPYLQKYQTTVTYIMIFRVYTTHIWQHHPYKDVFCWYMFVVEGNGTLVHFTMVEDVEIQDFAEVMESR